MKNIYCDMSNNDIIGLLEDYGSSHQLMHEAAKRIGDLQRVCKVLVSGGIYLIEIKEMSNDGPFAEAVSRANKVINLNGDF